MRIYVVVAGEKHEGYTIQCVTTNEELAKKEFEEHKYNDCDFVELQSCDQNNNNWVLLNKKGG